MTRRKGQRQSRGRGKTKPALYRLKGHALSTATIPTTSGVGGTVMSAPIEIDTELCNPWHTAATMFQRWRIRSIKFQMISLYGTDVQGITGMCILEDPDSSSPASFSDAIDQRLSVYAQHYKNPYLVYRPRHTGWLFTKDLLVDTDRLEMPGDLYVFTLNWSASVYPGYLNLVYDLEFDGLTTPATSAERKTDLVYESMLLHHKHVASEDENSLDSSSNQAIVSDTMPPEARRTRGVGVKKPVDARSCRH